MNSKFVVKFFTVGFFLSLVGCGSGLGDLKGKVTFQEKTLAVGSVLVEGSDGLVKNGAINEDGTYEVTGIGAGKVRIAVSSPNMAEVNVSVRKKKDAPPPRPKTDPKWFAIPESYADFEKSGLTFQLKTGMNKFDIDLKK